MKKVRYIGPVGDCVLCAHDRLNVKTDDVVFRVYEEQVVDGLEYYTFYGWGTLLFKKDCFEEIPDGP